MKKKKPKPDRQLADEYLRNVTPDTELSSGERDIETADSTEPTVRVRIAVAINADGQWGAAGWSQAEDESKLRVAMQNLNCAEDHDMLHWIEADVPIPQRQKSQTIQGEVKKA